MNKPLLALMLQLVLLHNIDGHPAQINPKLIVSISPPRDKSALTSGVKCIVSLADRKFVSVKETCDEVQALMEKAR